MNFHTIEQDFEYQMNETIKHFLKSFEKDLSDFKSGDELIQYLWTNSKDFGRDVIDTITSYKDENDWLKEIKGE